MGQERLVAPEPSQLTQVSSQLAADQSGLSLLGRTGMDAAAVTPGAVLQAQRLVGNSAVARALAIQRAPASDAPPVSSASAVGSDAAAPAEEAKADVRVTPDVVAADPLKIAPEKADKDFQEMLGRLTKIPTLNVEGFIGPMKRYVECAKARNTEEAHKAMSEALEFIRSRRLFEVNNKRYERLRKDDAPPAQEDLDKAAEESVTRANLWSKMNSYFSLSRAEGSGGLSLESSVGGQLFNGLDFGMDYRSNPILADQWKRVSMTYVEQVRGEVHAAVFRGVHPTSVLTKTEWPIIKKHLEEPPPRRVTAFFVHIFDFVHPEGDESAGPKTDHGEIEEKTKEPIVITSEEDWGTKLVHFKSDDPIFKADQEKVHASEEALEDARYKHKTGLERAKPGKPPPDSEKKGSFGDVLEEVRKGKQLSPAVPRRGPTKKWVKARIDEINRLNARYVEKK